MAGAAVVSAPPTYGRGSAFSVRVDRPIGEARSRVAEGFHDEVHHVRVERHRSWPPFPNGWPMRYLLRSNLRLKPSILASFFFLTVPVFFTIIAVTYLSNDSIARTNAKELVERFRSEAIKNIQDDFEPLKSLV